MEVEQLRHFLKVAELESFTRAADEIGLSQPALSRSIAKLESEIGQPILERQTRSVVPTDAGKLLMTRARQIVTLVDDTLVEITDDGQTGRIRVGAIPTIAPYYLPQLLRAFGKGYPNASVIINEEPTEQLLKSMLDGELDVAVMALPISVKYLDVEELFEEELQLVLPVNHPLADKPQVRLSDIQSLPFVLLGEAHCLTDNIVTFCRQKSFHPVSVERTSQLATVQELVALGHGISMVPEMARQLDHSKQRIYRSISGAKPTRKIAMVTNPYRYHSKLVKAFMRQVKATRV